MADNVPITAGTGTDVATDDVGSVHYQKVKLALGADGAIDTLLDSGQQTMANSAPVVIASDQSEVPVSNSVLSVVGGGTEATAQRVTIASDSTGVLSVDDNGSSLTVDGTVTANPGTISALHVVAASSTNATSVKASAGTLRGISFFNLAAVPIYVKFHNTAGTPTAGSGVVRTFGIQAGTQINFLIPGGGISFGTGIGMTIVKDLADNGTTATTANDAVGEVWYE